MRCYILFIFINHIIYLWIISALIIIEKAKHLTLLYEKANMKINRPNWYTLDCTLLNSSAAYFKYTPYMYIKNTPGRNIITACGA